jgi:dTMP kinase
MSPIDSFDYSGHLFVIEGIDGAGKTTVCDSVISLLRKSGHEVIKLREPTDKNPYGLEIRRRSPQGELSPEEELELFIRDREWNVKNCILPALRNGVIVLLDRYFFATGAYQSVSTGIEWRVILERNRTEIDAPEPEMVFILDIPAEEGLRRISGSGREINLQFEKHERLVKVRNAYLEMAREDKGRYRVIDATMPLQEVVEVILDEIRSIVTV